MHSFYIHTVRVCLPAVSMHAVWIRWSFITNERWRSMKRNLVRMMLMSPKLKTTW